MLLLIHVQRVDLVTSKADLHIHHHNEGGHD